MKGAQDKCSAARAAEGNQTDEMIGKKDMLDRGHPINRFPGRLPAQFTRALQERDYEY